MKTCLIPSAFAGHSFDTIIFQSFFQKSLIRCADDVSIFLFYIKRQKKKHEKLPEKILCFFLHLSNRLFIRCAHMSSRCSSMSIAVHRQPYVICLTSDILIYLMATANEPTNVCFDSIDVIASCWWLSDTLITLAVIWKPYIQYDNREREKEKGIFKNKNVQENTLLHRN